MKNYEKPVVMVNEGLAEGVYAASGDKKYFKNGNHWDISAEPVQELNGANIWEIDLVCNTGNVDDLSNKGVTVTLTFSEPVTVNTHTEGGFGAVATADGSVATISFTGGYCRHDQSQTMDCKINVSPTSAYILDSTETCVHP